MGGYAVSNAEHVQTSGEPLAKPSATRRLVHILSGARGGVLPALLMYPVAGELGVAAMFVGLLLGAVGAKLGGTRRMLYAALVVGLGAGFGAFTPYSWWWVVLLAAAGLITGAGIGFGWLPPLLSRHRPAATALLQARPSASRRPPACGESPQRVSRPLAGQD